MLEIVYTKNGECVPDHLCEEKILNALKNGETRIEISSELVIHALRALVCEGKVKNDEYVLYHEDVLVGKVGLYGKLINCPDGFCDNFERFLDRMLGL